MRLIVSNESGTVAFVWSTIVDAPVSGWESRERLRVAFPHLPLGHLGAYMRNNRAGPHETRVKTIAQLKKLYGKEKFDE